MAALFWKKWGEEYIFRIIDIKIVSIHFRSIQNKFIEKANNEKY